MAYKTNMVELGCCLECGKKLYGRTDKKFCGKTCKNNYHNKEIRQRNRIRSEIISRLLCNHDILCNMLKLGCDSAQIEELAGMGFDHRLVTGYRKGLYQKDEYACFDLRYYRTPTRIYRLHRVESAGWRLQSEDCKNQ